jgi:hypothetical protein
MKRSLGGMFVLLGIIVTAAACGGDDETASARTLEAPSAAITVDADTSDWDGIDGLDVMLHPIQGEEEKAASKSSSVKVAHDDEYVYVLFEVEDDYNWKADDSHLSAASAVMWNVDPEAGPHMGADDPSGEPGLGVVDIWHWELECASGDEMGGSVSDPGEGENAGNDGSCNFDDEYSSSPHEREDDDGEGAENSLLGIWSHTDATADAEGTWVFEARRPLQTGDEGDGQLVLGETAQLALAYWDPDNAPHGWSDDEHAQSSNEGWIEVTFAG